MYEELYQPLPDLGAYLERIQVGPSDQLDIDYLNRLILGHQMHIPFENLDVTDLHIPNTLDIPHLFDKQVTRRHGGYCFEMNALFTQALVDIGYNAYSVMVRIVRGRDYLSPIMHRGVIVVLDGEYHFCDVGFGGPGPSGAIRIAEGAITEARGVRFRMTKLDEYWWELQRENNGVFEKLFHFKLMPDKPVDFVVLNDYCSKSPDSNFTKRRFLNITTETGNISIMKDELTIKDGDTKTVKILATDEEFWEAAEKYFGITR